MELNYNIWHIEGYVGNDSCDGPADYNVNKNYITNAEWKKEQVIDMFCNMYKNYREVIVDKCNILDKGTITKNI